MKKLIFIFTLLIAFSAFGLKTSNAQVTCPTVPTNTGTVTLIADNVTAGNYKVWSRMKAADATNNSFYIKIDSESCATLVENSSTSWTWAALPNNVTLSAGNRTIVITGNEPGVGVDKLLLTKNLTCVPTGITGDNCPIEVNLTPTSTPTPTLRPTSTPTPTTRPTSTPTPTQIPLTATPTPTPLPNATILKFNSVKLHGIGNGGDNTNATSTGNLNPRRTTRTITVEVLDSSDNIITTATGNIVYKSATGDFSGEVTINSSVISSGTGYTIKVKSPQFLKRKLVGIPKISTGITNDMPNVVLVTGDINNDNELTLSDYNILDDCYSDLTDPKNCSDLSKAASADLSDDGRVNQIDTNYFLRELSIVKGD